MSFSQAVTDAGISPATPDMTELRWRIILMVRKAGDRGISGDELFRRAYSDYDDLNDKDMRYPGSRRGRNGGRDRKALKATIWQINKMIAQYGYRIQGQHVMGGWYKWRRLDAN